MYPYTSITVLIPLAICVLQDMHARRGEQWCSEGERKKHTDVLAENGGGKRAFSVNIRDAAQGARRMTIPRAALPRPRRPISAHKHGYFHEWQGDAL